MSVKHILKMIEEVSPDDTAKLYEIDFAVWDFVQENSKRYVPYHGFVPKYTRSRDALKVIRPQLENIWFEIKSSCHGVTAQIGNATVAPSAVFYSDKFGSFPTEELAELHAILQEIERSNNKQPETDSPAQN